MNPFDILKNAQSIKEQMSKVQDELKQLEVIGSAGGGIVKVALNGQFEMVGIEIDPIAVDPRDVPMLQDLIIAANHDAMSKIKEQMESRLGPMMSNLNIPGLNL